jgi:general secretion pathway protein J
MTVGCHDCSRSGGYVLVEALAALMLIALTLATLSSAMSFGRRVVSAGKAPEAIVSFAAGTDAISNWLAGALPVRERRSGTEGSVLFRGGPAEISFVTLSNGDVQPGGMLAIRLAHYRGRGGMVVFAALPLRPGFPKLHPDPISSDLPLLRGVDEVRFSYFGSLNAEDPPAWHEWWSDALNLPLVVRMRGAVTFNQQREAVDLLFRIHAR